MNELRKLAPHFMDDRNEDWMTYLPLDKKTFIIDKRAEILAISERIESHTISYRSLMISMRDATPERKEQARLEYESKKKSFEQTLLKEIRDLLPTLRRLRDTALQVKERQAREEAESLSKRPRLQDYLRLDPSLTSDQNVELVTDNYMPNYMPAQPSSSNQNNQNKKRKKSKRNTAEEMPKLQTVASPTKARDTFFDGVEDQLVRKVLSDLRSEIVKYNCRDRVIKAVQSIILRNERIAGIEKLVDLRNLVLNGTS